MTYVLNESLYKKNNKKFNKINDISKEFIGAYCGITIIRESIFGIVSNYARKKELDLEILRYPFDDEELWAITFIKKGTVFVCLNSELAMNKQIFAMAHELYHIYCYAENISDNVITGGSALESKTVEKRATTLEDLEANAFAGLLLMPDIRMEEQIGLFGIQKDNIGLDDVLVLMDLFALPYKAVVLRLVEGNVIKEHKAKELLNYDAEYIKQRIEITGRAMQSESVNFDMVHFGSLLDNLNFNHDNDLLQEERENSDIEYINMIKKGFHKGR